MKDDEVALRSLFEVTFMNADEPYGQYEHEKEPLSDILELLHRAHKYRDTPQQLYSWIGYLAHKYGKDEKERVETKRLMQREYERRRTRPTCTSARQEILNALQKVSTKDLLDFAVRAGIYTEDGKLTSQYRDEEET